jgi:carboxyl-terminal processing protease
VTQSLVFNYATLFAAQHESIPPVSEFMIDDDLYNDFEQYVENQDFSYNTRSEEILKNLIETAKREKYYSLASDEFKALEQKLSHDNLQDLENFKDEIKYFLKEEISGRYYYQKGKTKSAIENLPEIEKAIEVLNDPDLYASTLWINAPEKNSLGYVTE